MSQDDQWQDLPSTSSTRSAPVLGKFASLKRLFSPRKKQADTPRRQSEGGTQPALRDSRDSHLQVNDGNDAPRRQSKGGTQPSPRDSRDSHLQVNDGNEAAAQPSTPRKAPSKWFSRRLSSTKKTGEQQQQQQPRRPPKPIPLLHAYAMQGDLSGVLEAITSGADVNETVEMDNMQGHTLEGVSALFLACQKNRTKVVKLLVENGADPGAKVYFSKNKEHCTCSQIAALNLNAKLALYLKKAKKKARKNGVSFPQHSPAANGGGRPHGQQVIPSTPASAPPRLSFAPDSYAPTSYTPQSQIASDDALSEQATSYDPESRRATEDGFHGRQMPQSPQAESSEPPPTVEGQGWSSFYLNPGFNMDMRALELESDDDKIDLNVRGLESRREHLRNLLNSSA
ncbi:hypothetical protein DUNSADRAFT_5770 [Dunaliella salina]|uniref:Ankyrin repeat protein n=1 Tax=Dunaliella salina TaxID=3046 RepID=A0ABQ7H771_DUNSA|nr:hypothetical protein DUNSADRAFT_5770 [Dunaliella salina]|eukprot:KAF5842694.1 hypothetical protein DUNSADRAFT_5770 [Dunaliella salina]